MTGAVNAMRKLHPYLPKHPAVAAELRKQNEEISPLTTKPKLKEEEQMDEVKLADLPIRTVKGTSYGADYKDPEGADDAWEKERFPKKRKSGPQGTMKRRFGTKSYEKIKGKLKAQYK
jgi:hypothetical protein